MNRTVQREIDANPDLAVTVAVSILEVARFREEKRTDEHIKLRAPLERQSGNILLDVRSVTLTKDGNRKVHAELVISPWNDRFCRYFPVLLVILITGFGAASTHAPLLTMTIGLVCTIPFLFAGRAVAEFSYRKCVERIDRFCGSITRTCTDLETLSTMPKQ